MPSVTVEITDNSSMVKEELQAAALRALVKCGLVAVGYAAKLCTEDTGLLRNSITYAVSGQPPAISSYKANKADVAGVIRSGSYNGTAPSASDSEMSVYIGSNVEYSAYHELGTGKYYPGGRPTPWLYQDAKGNWHLTHGQRAQPYLKPAVADHPSEYRAIIEGEMKG